MKNIKDILKALGIEIPEEQQAEFDKEFSANYKTVKEVDNLTTKLSTLQKKYDDDISQRDADLETLKQDLADAGEDKTKLEELTQKFGTLQTDYNEQKTKYEDQLRAQQYEFLVKEEAGKLNFTSNSARKAFVQDVLAKNLTVEDGKLMGFTDYVEKYKETDADAFAKEAPTPDPKPAPKFVDKGAPTPDPKPEAKEIPKVW